MTAALEDLSMDALAAGVAPDCDVRGCTPLPAIAIAWWDSLCCDEAPAANLLCEPHRDTVRVVIAGGGKWRCDLCGSWRHITRIEPLR